MKKLRKKKGLLEDFSSDSEPSDLDRSWQSSSHNADEPLALPLENMALVSCVSDLKPGDYILVKFSTTNKRKLTYKYVTTVLQLLNNDEIEIQCFEATDEENTEFIVIENDISVIDISDIVGKLPYPELKKSGS